MKNQVLEYIKTDRTLAGGRNLYNKLPGKSLALQNTFTKLPDNAENLQIMCYELCKHVGITERQLQILLNQKVTAPKVIALTPEPLVVLSLEEQLLAFDPATADYHDAKALAKELGVKAKSKKKQDVLSSIAEARAIEIGKQLQELPVEQKQSIKLREQFPFLREPTCPDSIKLLVSDMITAYENFVTEQPKLHEAMTAEQTATLAEGILSNYISNKEAWAELEYYKVNGEILGEHPLFDRLYLKEEITKMNALDLGKKITLLIGNINRNKNKPGNEDLVTRDEDLLAHAKAELEKRK